MILLLTWFGVIWSTSLACQISPLKVEIGNTFNNVSSTKIIEKDIFEVVRNNQHHFILTAQNLNKICLFNRTGDTVLHIAIYSGSTDCLRVLLMKGVDVNLKDKKNRTSIWVAASKGNIHALKVLHEFGANLNETMGGCKERRRTLLHEAASWGNDAAVSWLSSMNLDLEARECDGWTPLHWAAYFAHSRVLGILARSGGNVNVKSDFGSTPLHWASQQGNSGTVYQLIQLGAFLESRDGDGCTPLHRAAQHGRLGTVVLLTDQGAQVDARDNNGWTPLMMANFWSYNDVAKFLINGGTIDTTPATRNNASKAESVCVQGDCRNRASEKNICLFLFGYLFVRQIKSF